MAATPVNSRPRTSRPSRPVRGGRAAAARSAPPAAPSQLAFTARDGSLSVSWRLIVLLLVVAVSVVVLVPTLRVYVRQQAEERAVSAEVAQTQARVEILQHELARWEDPDFVRAQARTRLGYVMPGQQPYIVVDPESVVGDEAQEEYEAAMGYVPPRGPWYLELWESVEVAGE